MSAADAETARDDDTVAAEKNWPRSRQRIKAAFHISLMYLSTVSAFAFFACPLYWTLLVYPPLYHRIIEWIVSYWELYPVALMGIFGPKVLVSGDRIVATEPAILIMNHRTEVDWMFWWCGTYQACLPRVAVHRLKFILKEPLKHIPGPGWLMQMGNFLFVKRNWQEDRRSLARSLGHLSERSPTCQLLLFPEGTSYHSSTKRSSDAYAAKMGLPIYRRVLHPRTTGFGFVARHRSERANLDAVYDITVAYPDLVPELGVEFLNGKLPKVIHFNVVRIGKDQLPTNEEDLKTWLEERWRLKERQLDKFDKYKKFDSEIWPEPKERAPLVAALIFWTLCSTLLVTLLATSFYFRLWLLGWSILCFSASYWTSGLDRLQIQWDFAWTSFVTRNKRRHRRE
ncbi:hypothetical protein TKK_0010360 [Trichogramma kaykai]